MTTPKRAMVARNHIILSLSIMLLAVCITAIACGNGADGGSPSLPVGPATVQPAAATEPVPTPTQSTPPTPVPSPTAEPTSTPQATPTPEPTAEPTPAPVESPTPEAQPKAEEPKADATPTEAAMQSDLPPECIADGSLTDAKLVASCSHDAMSRLRTVKVDVDFNLAAMLPGGLPPGAEVPSMQLQIARVFPNDFSVVTTAPSGEMLQIIFTGGASYINDGVSNVWVKIQQAQGDIDAMLMSLNMVEQQMQDLDNPNIAWSDVLLSDDGSRYTVSYQPPVEQSAMQTPPLEVQLVIDTRSFLQHSASVLIIDAQGMSYKIADLNYGSHDEPFTIEPPDDFIEGDAALMPAPGSDGASGAPGVAEVVALSKNGEGNVDVTFSQPVTLIGQVGLHVPDPSTGGWVLPYIGGSGSDTLTFDAVPPDSPALIPGESLIVGFTFDAPESNLIDENGQPVYLNFEPWVYPE